MRQSDTDTHTATGNLSIGTVAKLTGISVHTLRAWEKRHSVVNVDRSETGRRLYNTEDVYRLRLLKNLTQAGHSIGNVAPLTDEQLERMLELKFDDITHKAPEKHSLSLALFSERRTDIQQLSPAIQQRLDIALHTQEPGELRELLAGKRVFTVVLIFDTLLKHQLRLLRQLKETEPRHNYFVVFSTAQREVIDELNNLGLTLIRAPIGNDKLFEKVLAHSAIDGASQDATVQRVLAAGEVPPHKFSRKQLERLANFPSAIDCECPQHLANLVRELTVFESYCQSCASKNLQDAALHNEIFKITAQARAMMEQGISLILEAENINIDYIAAER